VVGVLPVPPIEPEPEDPLLPSVPDSPLVPVPEEPALPEPVVLPPEVVLFFFFFLLWSLVEVPVEPVVSSPDGDIDEPVEPVPCCSDPEPLPDPVDPVPDEPEPLVEDPEEPVEPLCACTPAALSASAPASTIIVRSFIRVPPSAAFVRQSRCSAQASDVNLQMHASRRMQTANMGRTPPYDH
jgi:hypothetical protein